MGFAVMPNDILKAIADKKVDVHTARLAFLVARRTVMADKALVDDNGYQTDDGCHELRKGQARISFNDLHSHIGDGDDAIAGLERLKYYGIEKHSDHLVVTSYAVAIDGIMGFGKVYHGACFACSHRGCSLDENAVALIAFIARYSNGGSGPRNMDFRISNRPIKWVAQPGEARVTATRLAGDYGLNFRQMMSIINHLVAMGILNEPSPICKGAKYGMRLSLNQNCNPDDIGCDHGDVLLDNLKERYEAQLEREAAKLQQGSSKVAVGSQLGCSKGAVKAQLGRSKAAARLQDITEQDQEQITNNTECDASQQAASASSGGKPKKKKEKKVYDDRINELNARINAVSKLRKHDWRDVILYFENTHKLPGEKLVAFMGSDGFHGTWGDPETSWREICSTPSRLKRKGDHIAAKASRPPTQLSKRDYSRHDPTINLRDKSRWMP